MRTLWKFCLSALYRIYLHYAKALFSANKCRRIKRVCVFQKPKCWNMENKHWYLLRTRRTSANLLSIGCYSMVVVRNILRTHCSTFTTHSNLCSNTRTKIAKRPRCGIKARQIRTDLRTQCKWVELLLFHCRFATTFTTNCDATCWLLLCWANLVERI